MSNLREAAQQALEAIAEAHEESLDENDFECRQILLAQIKSLRAALAHPDGEMSADYERGYDSGFLVGAEKGRSQPDDKAQPSELDMHRADYQACKRAGFESPGELLDAYNTLLEKVYNDRAQPVEAWHGERKVTVYDDIVLRSWGPNIETQMSTAPRTLHEVQAAFVWLYAATTAALAEPADKAQPVASSSSFWLIERGPNQGQIPHVWWSCALGNISSGSPHGDWTNEAIQATRFATKAEAERAVIDLSINYCAVTSHAFVGQPATSSGGLQDAVSKALRKAYSLGHVYWQQADSESYSQNKKADETEQKFYTLVDETRALLAAPQPPAELDPHPPSRHCMCKDCAPSFEGDLIAEQSAELSDSEIMAVMLRWIAGGTDTDGIAEMRALFAADRAARGDGK